MLYFAYGSNMDMARMRSRGIKIGGASPLTLNGYRLVFNKVGSLTGEGYANIIPSGKNVVEGVVYEIGPEDFEILDGYEGVAGGHYSRVTFAKGKLTTYIANFTEYGLKPSREYLEHLLAGEPFLSQEYYSWLKQTPTLKVGWDHDRNHGRYEQAGLWWKKKRYDGVAF
ncbi:MAG: gamma-glutamylcyclotransferase [SAR324 cluster bacterium]|nr:gamma-glutamylcyclotransferase [SAR324 cluster bacterium]